MNSTMKLATKHINEAIEDDSLIIFVGAGVSANSQLPNWGELIDEFSTEMNLTGEPDYLKIAQYYYDAVGQHKYFQKIMSIFQRHANAEPNSIHDQIFRIKPRHIITTNYDTLLESKMESSLTKYEVIRQDTDIPYSKANHYLIKMHGDLNLKNIVLKEDDYLDYEDNFYMISTLIKSLIMNNTVLFIGYSLNDSTFNSIFRIIQKGFGTNAKQAFFYSVGDQNTAAVEYYKNKGIRVISDNENTEEVGIGECTTNFLESLYSDSTVEPATSDQLWNNISFLDQLFFVDTDDVVKYANLSSKAFLYLKDNFQTKDKEIVPSISENTNLSRFIESKTYFKNFLNLKRKNPYKRKQNPLLSEAYELYLNEKFKTAKIKFREIANQAYIRKDYWTYLVAEFNVEHTGVSYGKSPVLPEPSSGISDLSKVIESLATNGDKNTKKVCDFFKNEIQNFNFVYKKVYKMNKLLDDFRNERESYRNGGSSANSYLWLAKIELDSLIEFSKANCITIFQYTEFIAIVNRYFECLLIAYDNSKFQPNKESIFGETSSIINELPLEDIKNIVPYLKKDNLPTLLENYGISKIIVSDDALDYLLSTINSIAEELNDTYYFDKANRITKFINFISFVELKDIYGIITCLRKYPVMGLSSADIRKLLLILVNNKQKIKRENYSEISSIINQHMSEIIGNKLIDTHEKNFPLYAFLMKEVNSDSEEFFISVEGLEEKLSLINLNDVSKIDNYSSTLTNFYRYFDSNLKRLMDEILKKYEDLEDSNLDFRFITKMIIGGIASFESKKELILDSKINKINEKKKKGMTVYPDPREVAVADLFSLIQQNYFTLGEVKKRLDLESIRGMFPEVDWVLLKDHSDNTIKKLFKKQSYSNIKQYFCKSKAELKSIDNWVIKQATENKVKIMD